jgi:hypothetical protein
MKARLLDRKGDFDWSAAPPWNEEALRADLALDTLVDAMAQGDARIGEAAKKVILAAVKGDADLIRYRQSILQDCLDHPALVRQLYAIATEAMETEKKHYLGTLARYPHWVLSDAIQQMETFLTFLMKLRQLADTNAPAFESEGWTEFFAMLKRELDDAYFGRVQDHLRQLRFRDAMLLGEELGKGNKPGRYVLHRVRVRGRAWWRVWWEKCKAFFFPPKPRPLAFSIHPRDEAGARALERLRDRGISAVANALGQSKDHIRGFFDMLRSELAFYVGCLNLHEELSRKGEPSCMPSPMAAAERCFAFRGLYDVCLTLHVPQRAIGNDGNADGKGAVILTGANQGGKSTFLRSVGLAQMMMQCGMFVPASSFSASVCDGLFTHYKREEDIEMNSGKFDEELSRMSDIVDRLAPHSMILFNESFAATNEREGSEIARQIVTALLERSVRVFYVTHLYELADGFYKAGKANALFLRAGRQAGGARTFKLTEGKPLPTSFGEDLYVNIFGTDGGDLESGKSAGVALIYGHD